MAFPLSGILNSGLGTFNQLSGEAQPVSFVGQDGHNAGRTLIQFDAILGETYQQQSQPTSFPVEDGSVITDHIVRAPITFDMLGIVTDTPIVGQNALQREIATTLATAALPPFGVVAAGGALSLWESQKKTVSPSRAAYATLSRMQLGDPKAANRSPTIFTLATKLQQFANMSIADLTVQRDRESGASLSFALKLVQVVIVASQTINLGKLDKPALGALKQSLGEQQAQEIDGFSKGRPLGNTDATKTVNSLSNTFGG